MNTQLEFRPRDGGTAWQLRRSRRAPVHAGSTAACRLRPACATGGQLQIGVSTSVQGTAIGDQEAPSRKLQSAPPGTGVPPLGGYHGLWRCALPCYYRPVDTMPGNENLDHLFDFQPQLGSSRCQERDRNTLTAFPGSRLGLPVDRMFRFPRASEPDCRLAAGRCSSLPISPTWWCIPTSIAIGDSVRRRRAAGQALS